ncbi:hypothetical protein EDD17DRAFT_616276 [Pisolithus thermaeus]|nr:hypothetical protein EDD17DRAFT_616276 [Pisolithus thermaeus]
MGHPWGCFFYILFSSPLHTFTPGHAHDPQYSTITASSTDFKAGVSPVFLCVPPAVSDYPAGVCARAVYNVFASAVHACHTAIDLPQAGGQAPEPFSKRRGQCTQNATFKTQHAHVWSLALANFEYPMRHIVCRIRAIMKFKI